MTTDALHDSITAEELAALAAGDLAPPRRQQVEDHVAACDACRRRLRELRDLDMMLQALPPERPTAGTILATRRFVMEEVRPAGGPEILTLEEVAAMLRIEPDELGAVLADLPAFEIGGRIRVRRSRLLEWIEQRERDYGRGTAASATARILAGQLRKGVA